MIYPRCKGDIRQTYISVDGYVMPCCWMGNAHFFQAYKELHGDELEEMSVFRRDLNEILADPHFKKIEESWNGPQPFRPCQFFCSKAPEPKVEMRGTNPTRVIRVDRTR